MKNQSLKTWTLAMAALVLSASMTTEAHARKYSPLKQCNSLCADVESNLAGEGRFDKATKDKWVQVASKTLQACNIACGRAFQS